MQHLFRLFVQPIDGVIRKSDDTRRILLATLTIVTQQAYY